MSLRLKIHLVVGVLVTLFVLAVIALQLQATRSSVREEVVAANRVAGQLLNRTVWLQAAQGTPAMLAFLHGLGRVRANDITLYDAHGEPIYRSPPSPYKAGRDAPGWFESLVSPPVSEQSIAFPDGRLVIRADASRATIDAWDQLLVLALSAALLLLAVNVAVYWWVGRTVRPFKDIVAALGRIEAGQLDVKLRPLPGTEAAAIGAAFNRMVDGVRARLEAERELSDRRDLSRWIERHLEHERKLIARELHDELGQSVTGIRSLALSIVQRAEASDPQAAQAARVIADESSRLYDAMHSLIPRLAPLVLDVFGLGDALRDLVERTRVAQPQTQVDLQVRLGDLQLGTEATLALYRAAQEGLTNALRHGEATHIAVTLSEHEGGALLSVRDDGHGLRPTFLRRAERGPGHYGLLWLTERLDVLRGRLSLDDREPRGAELQAWVPTEAVAPLPRREAQEALT